MHVSHLPFYSRLVGMVECIGMMHHSLRSSSKRNLNISMFCDAYRSSCTTTKRCRLLCALSLSLALTLFSRGSWTMWLFVLKFTHYGLSSPSWHWDKVEVHRQQARVSQLIRIIIIWRCRRHRTIQYVMIGASVLKHFMLNYRLRVPHTNLSQRCDDDSLRNYHLLVFESKLSCYFFPFLFAYAWPQTTVAMEWCRPQIVVVDL